MANYKLSEEEIASWFITSTCQLIPKSDIVADHMHRLSMSYNTVPIVYLIHCGSTAEFYIRPLNSCVNDIDVLTAEANQLGFNDDVPMLPTDLSGLMDTINCYQIESHQGYPGFVRLRVLGELSYDWKHKQYEYTFSPTARTGLYAYISLDLILSRCGPFYFISGPALKRQAVYSDLCLEGDSVKSLFCPQWPRDARNWPIRPRKYGWPTSGMISEIVQNGCHVVYAQHRSCRDDKYQWRLSFSFAEVILLQSWTQTQQIVYHLLRFFAKRELIQKDCPKEDEILCTYHLKTLMLWTCEDMPSKWWNSSSVIAVCCELLKKLLEWLKRKYYPHYFIPESNLFHDPLNSAILEKNENRIRAFFDTRILGHWFVENYILPILPSDFKVDISLEVMSLLEFRKALVLNCLDAMFTLRFEHSHDTWRPIIKSRSPSGLRERLLLSYYAANVKSQKGFLTFAVDPVLGTELCFTYFDNLLFVLQFAHSLSRYEINLDSFLFVELINKISMQLKVIRSRYHNIPKTFTTQGSRFQFLRALDFMQNLTGSNSRPEFQLISRLSKEYLIKALQCEDSQINDIAPAAFAYLAALYFASSEYHETIRSCLAVIIGQTSEEEKETLNSGCLLFIDDIARIVGLCVLHKKIIDKNLPYVGRRLYLDLRLSPAVFAHYLCVLSAEKISKQLDFYYYLPNLAYSVDEYLNELLKLKYFVSEKSSRPLNTVRQIVYRRADSLTEPEAANMNNLIVRDGVIDALVDIALENVAYFYNAIRTDFGIQCNTADCYRALYLYKYRYHNELLNLCEEILLTPDLQSELRPFSYANVLVLPPLDYFFDEDVQSLLGFRTLLFYLSPLDNDLHRFDDTCIFDWTFKHWFETYCAYSLKTPHPCDVNYVGIRYRFYIGRHFLARYLKVRCCIDCNLPSKETLTEFAAHRNTFPIEHIIYMFLLHKLGFNKK